MPSNLPYSQKKGQEAIGLNYRGKIKLNMKQNLLTTRSLRKCNKLFSGVEGNVRNTSGLEYIALRAKVTSWLYLLYNAKVARSPPLHGRGIWGTFLEGEGCP